MAEDNTMEKIESLGEYLLRQRKEKNLTLEDVFTETRIPLKTLFAMESDDYTKLPSAVFARGFFSLYANFLELDTKDILERYVLERGHLHGINTSTSPITREKRANAAPTRRSVALGAAFGVALGMSLMILIVIFAALRGHLSLNPATFVSERMGNMQQPVVIDTQRSIHEYVDTGIKTQNTFALPANINYVLRADFIADTTVTISIDDIFPEKAFYSKNSSQRWYAKEAVTLIFPESAGVNLFLNGSEIFLPQPVDGFVTVNLP